MYAWAGTNTTNVADLGPTHRDNQYGSANFTPRITFNAAKGQVLTIRVATGINLDGWVGPFRLKVTTPTG